MQNAAILIITMILTGCVKSPHETKILWKESSRLPAEDGKAHLGLAGPLVGVIDDQLLIAGGANFPQDFPWNGGEKIYQRSAYLYSIKDDQIDLKSEMSLATAIAYSATFSDGSNLYTVGGENENGAVDLVYKYRLDAENELTRESLAHLPIKLTNGGLIATDDHLYFIGGENSEMVSDKIYRLQLSADGSKWETFLSLPYPVSNAVVVTDKNDRIYVSGGRKKNPNAKSDIYDELIEVNIPSRTVKAIANLPRVLAAGTGIYWHDQIIFFGGDDASTFHQVEEILAQINKTANAIEKDSLMATKNQLQQNHPGFRKEIIAFDLKNRQWKEFGKLPGLSPVTTTAVLHNNLFIIPSGEIRAGVRTDQILIGLIK